MVVSFFFVFLSSVPVIAQMGWALRTWQSSVERVAQAVSVAAVFAYHRGCLYCFGVALDVYIVRLWLAPAALCIFEQANYWPGKVPDPTKCCLKQLEANPQFHFSFLSTNKRI